jgi:hypothetical protein
MGSGTYEILQAPEVIDVRERDYNGSVFDAVFDVAVFDVAVFNEFNDDSG